MPSNFLSGSEILLLCIKLKGHEPCQLPTLPHLKEFGKRILLLISARLNVGYALTIAEVIGGVAFLFMAMQKGTEGIL
jgi:hypothetical protein